MFFSIRFGFDTSDGGAVTLLNRRCNFVGYLILISNNVDQAFANPRILKASTMASTPEISAQSAKIQTNVLIVRRGWEKMKMPKGFN